jgi:hypothetical protein
MRKILVFQLILLVGVCTILLAADMKSYGEGVTQGDVTPISNILANPEAFAGKAVRVQGRITDVCRKAGCWMDIRDDSGRGIQIKVDDGVIIFPVDAIGSSAIAEGQVEVLDMSREGYVSWLKHMAEENGREFDESSIAGPPYRVIRVKATGAAIGE